MATRILVLVAVSLAALLPAAGAALGEAVSLVVGAGVAALPPPAGALDAELPELL